MGCGHSKSDDAVIRVTSAHVMKEFNKRRNSTKSASSSSSSGSDDSKHVSKKGKKKKDNVVSPVIKANEDKIINNESQKPLTPTPKSASSRGSRTRKSSSSGFSEHEKDTSSIDRNEVERKADDEDGEKGTAIFTIGGNDEEDINTPKDTGTTHESVIYIKEDGGEDNQKANDDEMSQPGIIADGEEEEEDEDNIDGKSGNNENDNDTQQIKEQQVDDEEDLGIYEDNGNNNDIDDENDKTPRSVGEDDFDDTEQQMNSDGEDVPDSFLEHNDANDTEHNKSTEPSHGIANEDHDRSDEGDRILTLTPSSEREEEA
ncbi:hypothetical protein CHS0354_004831 [Potamilus streckersoni]|uniref:Uncharacterized protein n=1 Tax=Potamilus streckersoni TaxID=2493646 RepID=A0AAE0S952_9BIVA|nr:hypothetical protein CHS0354_004831 [Potamilus streckersoni]